MKKFAVIVPVLNAGERFREFLAALAKQTYKPSHFLVLDSESTDDTAKLAKEAGATLIVIKRSDFNHGGTRMVGVNHLKDYELVIFLTQDAVLASETSLERLAANFDDDRVDVAYGRQLPHSNAGPIEIFARLFNYPDRSESRSALDIPRIGFKTCFCSNSFAAYRVKRLIEVGGFPHDVIFGEDALVVAKLILSGSTVHYDAEATIYHSHGYTLVEEFKRYFDIGVMHSRSAEILMRYGSASSAGRSFVIGELKFLAKTAPHLIPEALIRTCIKYVAYKLGTNEGRLPVKLKRSLSMNRTFWAFAP